MTNQPITPSHLTQSRAPPKTAVRRTPPTKLAKAPPKPKKEDVADEGGSAHAFDDLQELNTFSA
jgi:hypothetical protein